MHPIVCPKFEKCSAPLCPLDAELSKRVHRDGDRICIYLREYAKPTARPILEGVLPLELWNLVVTTYLTLIASNTYIRKGLAKSSKTRPRIGHNPNKDKKE